MTLGDNPMIDMILSLIGFMLVAHGYFQQSYHKICATFFLALAAMYTVFGGNLTGYIAQFFMVFIPIQVIFLNNKYQLDLFNSLSNWFAVLLFISVLWWILWLMGIPLPHTTEKLPWQYNEFGFLNQNYFFFRHAVNLSPYATVESFLRFNGFFLEPGHIGTITSLFLYANKYNLREKRNIIFLVVIIISFSAAAYILTFIGYLFYKFSYRPVKIIVPIIFSCICLLLVLLYNNGHNLINELIFDKLTRDSGAIEGRFSSQTQLLWNQVIADGRIFFGAGAGVQVPQSSGYKVYLIMNGLFGAFLIILAYWHILQSNRSKLGLYMFFLLMISFLQRVYATWDAFLDPYILGLTYLQHYNHQEDIYV